MNSKFTRLTADVGNVTSLVKIKRLGKIRLGIKKKSANTGKEFPAETDHFICPPEVTAVYGDTPTELDAMFASNDPEEIYTEKLALYGSGSGLRCHGDGVVAERKNEAGKWEPLKCPCPFLKTEDNPKGQCTPQAHLMVMLPKISMWGNYQITTRSLYARAGILASLKQLQDTIGRIAYIPLKLNRVPQEIAHGDSKKTHYIVGFVPALTLPQIIELRSKPELMVLPAQYQIEAPVDTNPEDDPVDVIVDEDAKGIDAEELANMEEQEIAAVQAKLNQQRARQGDGVGKAEQAVSDHQQSNDAPVPLTEQDSPPTLTCQQACDWLASVQSVKEWAEWMNAAQVSNLTAEERKTVHDHGELAMRRLKGEK